MDVDPVVMTYLDRCQRVGRQETFSDLVDAMHSAGATPEEVFEGIRWLFESDYVVRTRPNEFALTEAGRVALEAFRSISANHL